MSYKYFAAVAALAISLPSFCMSSPIPLSNINSNNPSISELMKRSGATVINACTVPNSFAVTFDDGPSAWTHELLDYLAIKNVKVTFFVNGQNYNLITDQPYADVVRRAHAEGHQIGSHTWSHADLTLPSTNIASEMGKLDDALKTIIGKRPTYMRPPYGNTSPEVLSWLGSRGYKVIDWNVDTNDWQHPEDFKQDLDSYKKALQGSNAQGKSFISLQHDAEKATAEVFSKLAIEYVLSKGYQLMTVGECLGDTTGWYKD
ncbi:chitin deacetylase [Haplosporangium sp. Z 27]|nr:chitin deacetylase [Haplosporangium sp. Z 27]